MEITIVNCKERILWYRKFIGEKFKVIDENGHAYRLDVSSIQGSFYGEHWAYKDDCEIVGGAE